MRLVFVLKLLQFNADFKHEIEKYQNLFGFLNNCIDLAAVNSPYYDGSTRNLKSTC